jgi:hypothetical protein
MIRGFFLPFHNVRRRIAIMAAIIATVGGLLAPPTARANIGPRWWGDVVTDAWGIKEVVIDHEQLTIDLRPLSNAEPIRMEVVYRLRNSGAAKKLGLLFVSGQEGVSEFEARLDDAPIAARLLPPDKSRWGRFPESWRPPVKSVGFSGDIDPCWFRQPDESVPIALDVELPSGSSTLRVRYRARACGTDEGRPVVTWQLPYVLSPARDWGGFGALDVTVHVPDGWEAKSTPELGRDGSTLRGHFDGLPADALVVATRGSVPAAYTRTIQLLRAGLVLVWAAGALACWYLGRRLGKYMVRVVAAGSVRRAEFAWPLVPLLSAALWAAFVGSTGALFPYRLMRAALGSQESPYFYEAQIAFEIASMAAAAVTFVVGFFITQLSARRMIRRIKFTQLAEAESFRKS